jgi:hypothetical protein
MTCKNKLENLKSVSDQFYTPAGTLNSKDVLKIIRNEGESKAEDNQILKEI